MPCVFNWGWGRVIIYNQWVTAAAAAINCQWVCPWQASYSSGSQYCHAFSGSCSGDVGLSEMKRVPGDFRLKSCKQVVLYTSFWCTGHTIMIRLQAINVAFNYIVILRHVCVQKVSSRCVTSSHQVCNLNSCFCIWNYSFKQSMWQMVCWLAVLRFQAVVWPSLNCIISTGSSLTDTYAWCYTSYRSVLHL